MISTTMCTRMMMIWSVSPRRQKLNSMALARGCVHSFLSGQPAAEPSGGRSLIPWRWRVDVCILSCQEGPAQSPVEAPAFILQGRFHVYLHRIQEVDAAKSQPLSVRLRISYRILWARQGRNLNLQACCPQCSVS